MRALIVEDDPHNIELLEMRLAALDCETVIAKSPREAFQVALAEVPDFILLDIRLGLDHWGGVEVLDLLHTTPTTSEIPVIVHSILVARKSDEPGLTNRTQGILPKPFKFLDLKALVEELRIAKAPNS